MVGLERVENIILKEDCAASLVHLNLPMAARIVIFEDNQRVRESLAALLHAEKDYSVCGAFPTVNGVSEVIRRETPDVVILDIDMPGMDGISAIPIIKEVNPEISIVMYTQFEDDEKLFKSLCAGADGYVLKKTTPAKLLDAIEEVRKGGAPLSPAVARKVLFSFRDKPNSAKENYDLTDREMEVLQLLTKGYSVKLIASDLHIAYDTCRSHLRNIYRKLHVNCGKEAIAKVLAEKIIL